MSHSSQPSRSLFVILVLVLSALAGCRSQAPEPAPTAPVATTAPQTNATTAPSAPLAEATQPAGPRVRPTATPGRIAGLGLASFARASEPLKVLTTLPKADATGVPVGGDCQVSSAQSQVSSEKSDLTSDTCPRVVVQFNHPVVPLVGVAEQATLASPLKIDPPAQGQGEWLNTSTYVFRPERLQPSTKYTVTVSDLADQVGTKLEAPFTFSFTTVYPGVLKTEPADNAKFIAATGPIVVTFNQPMNQAEAQAAFSLRGPGGQPVSGSFKWDGATMTFTPAQPLARDATYTAQVKAGAKDAGNKEALREDRAWTFQTAPAPGLAGSVPANGAQGSTEIRSGLQLTFASPMDRDGLQYTIAPTLTYQSVFWLDDSNTKARLNGAWQASTDYTVTIKGESKTRSGETLGQDIVLRFSSAPRAPMYSVGAPSQVAMYDANRAPNMSVALVNVQQVDFRLSTMAPADLLPFLGRDAYQQFERYQPPANRQVRAWSARQTPKLNETTVITTTLTERGNLAPGAYFLNVSSPQARSNMGSQRDARYVLLVSDTNLMLKRTDREALVWATSLKTAQPVAGLPVTVYGFNREILARGSTDADGVFRAQFDPLADPYVPIYVLSERDGQVVAGVGSDWSDGIYPFEFKITSSLSLPDYTAQLYTERPLYRPGDKVYYKGILRQGRDGAYSLPTLDSVPITVRDSQGREIAQQNAKLTPYGTFSGEVPLAPGAALGHYNITLKIGDEPGPNNTKPQFFSETGFQVAEYRKPEFEVQVKPDKESYVNGDTVNVTADSAYFFGGPVANARLKWRLFAADFFYTPPDTLKGYWDFTDTDIFGEVKRRTGEMIREGTGQTDAKGQFAFQVPATLGDYPNSQNFTLEVEMTDINGQSVASRRVVPVHKGAFYIGMRPAAYIGQAGQPQRADLVVLDTQGISVTNQALTVTVYRRDWFSTRQRDVDGIFRWTSVHTDTQVASQQVTSNAQGAASVTYTPSQAGTYRLVAEAKDSRGNTVRSATYQWVAGNEYVNWRIDNNDRFDVTPDKKSYAPGETARLLIQSPVAPAEALLTVERGGIREVRRFTVSATSQTLDVPIKGDYTPNVYISVALAKGGDDKTLPQFKLGYATLNVATSEKLLDIRVEPDKPGPYQPGQTVGYTLTVRDAQGKPVQAEFSLALVDKALLSLVEDRTQPPAEAFYSARPLGVTTAASFIRNVNRASAQIADAGGKGGGGGGGDAAPLSVRSDFRDTAFWKADVVTDEAGRARVDVKLPDNLTTWSLAVLGTTKDTLVGLARLETLVSKDLMVRPALPRFLIQGDQVRLTAVVQNNTDRALDTQVTLQTRGLDGKVDPIRVTVPAKGKTLVGWDTVVGAVDQAETVFAVDGGGLSDSTSLKLPVYRNATPETVGTAGVATGRTDETIRVPAEATPGLGGLTVNVNPSLGAVTADSLRYLTSTEYHSCEYVVSRFLPSIASVRAAQQMGLPYNRDAIAPRVSEDMQRLYSLQNGDGGWGWWPGEPSHPFLTAYAVLGLGLADQTGFSADKNTLDRAVGFLNQYLDEKVDTAIPGMLSQRAFVLYALAEIGRPNLARTVALYDSWLDMSLYGRGFLLLALHKADAQGQAPRIRALVQNLQEQAKATAAGTSWEENVANPLTMNTNTRTTAIALLALNRATPGDALLPNVVRWLMTQRQASGGWRSTQETAWAVLALTDYMVNSGDLKAAYRYSVNLNGKDILTGDVSKANLTEAKQQFIALQDLVTNVGNSLTFDKQGEGNLYYTAYLTYYPQADQSPALDRGILVGRQYLQVDPQTLKPTGQPAQGVKVGDYVQVKLTVIAPTTLNYLIVEDPLPAGFEAVDVSLKTASLAAQGPTVQPVKPGQGGGTPATGKGFPDLGSPYWAYWSHSEVRDAKVALFAQELRPGAYEYT